MLHQSITLLSLIGVFPAPAGGISESLSGALPQAPLIADLRQQKAFRSQCTMDNVKYVNPNYDPSFGAYGYCIIDGQAMSVNAAGVISTDRLDKVKADRSTFFPMTQLSQVSEDNGKLILYKCWEDSSNPLKCSNTPEGFVRGVLKR